MTTNIRIPEISAVIGIVKTQAQTILWATPHITDLNLLDVPTPIMVVVIFPPREVPSAIDKAQPTITHWGIDWLSTIPSPTVLATTVPVKAPMKLNMAHIKGRLRKVRVR